MLRLWGDRVEEIRPKIAADLRETLAEFDGPDGVVAPASTWIIGATRPPERGCDSRAGPNNLFAWPMSPRPNRYRRGSPRSASS